MRRNTIVTYDICDEKRLRKVLKICKGFGIHLQYSVFECDLTREERARMEASLAEVLKHDEDQVLFMDLGPSEARGEKTIAALGKVYHRMEAPCYVF